MELSQGVKREIGCLILTTEGMERNRSRMVMLLEKGDTESLMRAKALISMQKDDCWRYMQYLRDLTNEITKSHEHEASI